MKELKKCEICGSNRINFLFEGNDKLLRIPGKFSLFECRNCKTIFLNPQPAPYELEKYYSNEKYYSLKKIDSNSKKLGIKLLLYKIYFDKRNKNIFLRFLFSPLKFIMRGTVIIENLKLLDIGCGSGQFLYEMKILGLDVYGIEPGKFDETGSKKYNLHITKGILEYAKYKKDFFDIITMNHVLEHINNPNETISEVKRVIKKDGPFILSVPNSNSLAFWIFGKNWLALDVPRHLFNYSNKNLKFLLKRNGFIIKKIRYNSRPNQFVSSLYFLFGIKKRTGILNRILEGIFLPLTWLVNLLKIGDQIEIWCIKK